MAFNPFHSFRKHQKYWMAGAVLVCMMTFVLCSGGMKGMGIDDLILGWTRKRGSDYVKVNGRGYTYEAITELKTQRSVANDFMRELTKTGMAKLEYFVKERKNEEKPSDQLKAQIEVGQVCLGDLYNKLTSDQRYFRGGTKLDDLVEFLIWRDIADKYNIQLTDDMVRELVNRCVHAQMWGFDENAARRCNTRYARPITEPQSPSSSRRFATSSACKSPSLPSWRTGIRVRTSCGISWPIPSRKSAFISIRR